MSKAKPEGAIQKVLRESRERVRNNNATAIIGIVQLLTRKPGALTLEAKAYIAEAEALTDAQLDDDEFYNSFISRGNALVTGAGQSATTFRH